VIIIQKIDLIISRYFSLEADYSKYLKKNSPLSKKAFSSSGDSGEYRFKSFADIMT
jgi:hypothetical protein